MVTASADSRIERLSTASASRVVEPDLELTGELGPGPVIAPDLLSVDGLDLALTAEQLSRLAREEVASILDAGLRFEGVLMSGFGLWLSVVRDLTDARVVYALHEVGEETRHSRLFSRLIAQLAPEARNPLDRWPWRRLQRIGTLAIVCRPALFDVLVLAGEEIPDLLQKMASEHPGTDPFLAEANRYHRLEEARHLAFARTMVGEHWASAGWSDRFAVRHIAPGVIAGMFALLVHPGVYAAVGLPRWPTWWAANRTPRRVSLRHQATRPVLAALLASGVLRRVPRGWRHLCGVDARGEPRPRCRGFDQPAGTPQPMEAAISLQVGQTG